jgi:hypothetical protein
MDSAKYTEATGVAIRGIGTTASNRGLASRSGKVAQYTREIGMMGCTKDMGSSSPQRCGISGCGEKVKNKDKERK